MGLEALTKSTQASSLEWDQGERHIDRIVAMAMGTSKNEIGSNVIRAMASDNSATKKVILLVYRELQKKHKITRTHGYNIISAALIEFLRPTCKVCGGIPYENANLVIICPSCSGTGLHRYSDADRMAMVGSRYNTQAYEIALSIITEKLSRAIYHTNQLLK